MSQFDNIQDWASGGLGEGQPTLSTDDIQAGVETDLSALGSFHTDISTIPLTADGRANGVFASYDDLLAYLEGGGLVFRDSNDAIVPNPIIHIARLPDPFGDGVLYGVYVEDAS